MLLFYLQVFASFFAKLAKIIKQHFRPYVVTTQSNWKQNANYRHKNVQKKGKKCVCFWFFEKSKKVFSIFEKVVNDFCAFFCAFLIQAPSTKSYNLSLYNPLHISAFCALFAPFSRLFPPISYNILLIFAKWKRMCFFVCFVKKHKNAKNIIHNVKAFIVRHSTLKNTNNFSVTTSWFRVLYSLAIYPFWTF